MAAKKSTAYIDVELELADKQLAKMAKYLEDNPYDEVEDRKELMKTKTGGAYYAVVQNIEAIQKNIRETLKEFLAIAETVKRLRQADDAAKEKEAKGTAGVPHRMQKPE